MTAEFFLAGTMVLVLACSTCVLMLCKIKERTDKEQGDKEGYARGYALGLEEGKSILENAKLAAYKSGVTHGQLEVRNLVYETLWPDDSED